MPLLLLLLLLGAVGTALPAHAQPTQGAEQPAQAAALPPRPVGALQIATRARVLADSASFADGLIEEISDLGDLTAEVEDAEGRYQELQMLLATMVEADFVRVERLSRLHDHALIEDARLEGVESRLIDRLSRLEEIDARWGERRLLWGSWLDTLRTEPPPDLAESEGALIAALERTAEVLDGSAGATTALFGLQTRADAVRREITQLGETITRIQIRRREARFERSGPLLFSTDHRAQLREGGWRAWDPTSSIQPGVHLAFVRNSLGLLAFHTLLALLVGGTVLALRSTTPPQEVPAWSGLLEHPWALGVLASVLVAMTRVTLAPPLWDVLLWSLFGVCAAILARRAIDARALRLTVYLLSVFYPTFLLLEVSQVPESVFRIGLAAVAVCAIPLFLLLASDGGTSVGDDARSVAMRARAGRTWPLLLGAGIWIGVLAALIIGFDALARWTLHATAMSAAVVYTVALGFVLVRGANTTLRRLGTEGPLVRRAGLLLVRRSSLVFRAVMVVVAGLVLLDIWGLSGSPITTWQRVMDAGFTLGSFPIRVGALLLGGFVLYLSVLLSGLVRTVVSEAPGERGEGRPLHASRGVTESITRLGQYAFVTLGLILALGLMGVQLQNFAIVAGALGIGVGFGLQNVVNNFASGLILLFERPVRVGDTVVVGGTWGTIRKIGLRSTLMLTLDESEMIVPNGDLVAEKVINWTLTSPVARVFLPVGVAYGSPIPEVQEILKEAAFAHPTVLKEPAPQALFTGFGDSSLDFELRVWVSDIRLRLEMRSVVLADIDRRLREAGIQIPFPQRDLHLRSVDRGAIGRLVEGGPPEVPAQHEEPLGE